ncbi:MULTISPECIES: PDZ domain-containing protein [unclassified Psychrobacillus]|uniref:PDZ domain-containing protein n=1 Tax=unclassified Psychrobacillus TaxID=2636677 RepID=UPI00146EF77B|nr:MULTISPECIES: PDZ domain-containing protein [unclassified Psychrobacillus]MCM3356791.1 PDZ domain-containing protein [Psychrobacillus sp. MER TA 171]NME07343.1 PDZ domain-containing protein [Psychrobacillus sp. BL-248-WT-3]
MVQEILIELAKGIGRFFLHPAVYITLLFSVLIGYFRVKRERKQFRARILWGWTEAKHFLLDGYVWAIIISVISVAVGLVIPSTWLMVYSVWMILFVLLFMYQVGSAIYAIALAVATFYIMFFYDWSYEIFSWEIVGQDIDGQVIVPIAILAGLLLIAEGFIIQKHGATNASPRLVKTARGSEAMEYVTKRLWLLPILLVIPGDVIHTYLPFWPQFTLGESTFSLVLFPFVIGFQQKSRHSLAENFFPMYGKKVWQLGIIVTVVAAVGYIEPLISLIALALGVIGRLVISFIEYRRERNGSFAVSPQSNGVMIAGVLSDSPAEKMGLKIGECIVKVNGQKVTDEQELYEAVQINAAHCRLEVLDHNGELRLRQHVLFRHDHYRLGLILVR